MAERDQLEELRARVEALEAGRAEVEQRAGVALAASRAWRVLAQVRDRLLVGTDAGDLAQIPVTVARVLAAGRPLDLDAREAGPDVELLDGRGVVVARLSKPALLGLSKALQTWQSQTHPSRTATRTVPGARKPARQAGDLAVSGVRLDSAPGRPVSPPVSPPVAPPPPGDSP